MRDVFVGLGGLGAGGVGWLLDLPPAVVVAVVALLVLAGVAVRVFEIRGQERLARLTWAGAAEVYRVKGDGAAVARAVHQAPGHPTEQAGPCLEPAEEGRWWRRWRRR